MVLMVQMAGTTSRQKPLNGALRGVQELGERLGLAGRQTLAHASQRRLCAPPWDYLSSHGLLWRVGVAFI